MQEQIDSLRDAIIDLNWSDLKIIVVFFFCILFFTTIGALNVYDLSKRLKKVEKMLLANQG